MTIVHVQVRDAKGDPSEPLFAEYLEIPDAADASEIIRGALAQAFFTHGVKRAPRDVLPLARDTVISLYVDKRLSTIEIGAVYNCGKEAVSRFLRANDVPMRPKHRRRVEPTQQQREQVLALAQAKATRDEILTKTGLSAYYLRELQAEYGIKLPKGRRPRGQ